jgi:hypothetical protein
VIRVDRGTLAASVIAAPPGADVQVAASEDADVLAVAWPARDGAPAAVAVHAGGAPRADRRVETPSVEGLGVSAAGTTVAWIERGAASIDALTDDGYLHTLDPVSGAHRRVHMRGSGCAVAPEVITRVEEGAVLSDASCSLGCPSVRWTRKTVRYDAASGRILAETSTTETQSYNEESAALSDRLGDVAADLGVARSALLGVGTEDTLVVVTGSGALAVVGVSDPLGSRVDLERSAGASLASVVLAPDASVVAAVLGGRAAAWDAATGRRLL